MVSQFQSIYQEWRLVAERKAKRRVFCLRRTETLQGGPDPPPISIPGIPSMPPMAMSVAEVMAAEAVVVMSIFI
jgi:hypothetical protein